MDSVFAVRGKGFAIVAADATMGQSIMVFNRTTDKIWALDSHKLCGASGVAADRGNFLEYVEKNMKLIELENGYKIDMPACSSYVRNEMATALRKGPYQINLVLAGYDGSAETGNSSVYFIDMYASCVKLNFAAQGYCSNFILSTCDREWKEDLTEAEGLDLVRKCINEINSRMILSQQKFIVKVVDHNGVRVVEI